eukprot:RCo018463
MATMFSAAVQPAGPVEDRSMALLELVEAGQLDEALQQTNLWIDSMKAPACVEVPVEHPRRCICFCRGCRPKGKASVVVPESGCAAGLPSTGPFLKDAVLLKVTIFMRQQKYKECIAFAEDVTAVAPSLRRYLEPPLLACREALQSPPPV